MIHLTLGCGGWLTSSEGFITSPLYYPPSEVSPSIMRSPIECSWMIAVPIGLTIEMKFEDIDMTVDEQCSRDYVEVIEGIQMIYLVMIQNFQVLVKCFLKIFVIYCIILSLLKFSLRSRSGGYK